MPGVQKVFLICILKYLISLISKRFKPSQGWQTQEWLPSNKFQVQGDPILLSSHHMITEHCSPLSPPGHTSVISCLFLILFSIYYQVVGNSCFDSIVSLMFKTLQLIYLIWSTEPKHAFAKIETFFPSIPISVCYNWYSHKYNSISISSQFNTEWGHEVIKCVHPTLK